MWQFSATIQLFNRTHENQFNVRVSIDFRMQRVQVHVNCEINKIVPLDQHRSQPLHLRAYESIFIILLQSIHCLHSKCDEVHQVVFGVRHNFWKKLHQGVEQLKEQNDVNLAKNILTSSQTKVCLKTQSKPPLTHLHAL